MQDNTTAADKSKIKKIRTWIQKVKIMNTYCFNDRSMHDFLNNDDID